MNAKAFIHSILAGFFYALAGMLAKQIHSVSKINLALWSNLVRGIYLLPAVTILVPATLGIEKIIYYVKSPNTFMHIFYRVFYSYVAMIAFFKSLDFSSIGDSATIRSLTPAAVAVIAYFKIGERSEAKEVWLMLASIIGMIFIGQPWNTPEKNIKNELPANLTLSVENSVNSNNLFTNFYQNYPFAIGTFLCVLSVIADALSIVSMRALGKNVHYLTLTYFMAMFGGVVILPVLTALDFFKFTGPESIILKPDIYQIIILSVVGTACQISKKLATDNAPATLVQLLGNSQAVFSSVE